MGNANGDVLIVTGGLSGIGAAVAAAAAAEGWTAVVLDRATGDPPPGAVTYPQPVDVTDETAVARACDAIESRHGPIAGLVNAAGILGKMHPPQRIALADWDREIAVDLRGTFVPCREAGMRMARCGRGAIVNIASIAGMTSGPLHGYAPAKAAVIQLTATLAGEWGPSGVRVNCVSPGFTKTPALEKGSRLRCARSGCPDQGGGACASRACGGSRRGRRLAPERAGVGCDRRQSSGRCRVPGRATMGGIWRAQASVMPVARWLSTGTERSGASSCGNEPQ